MGASVILVLCNPVKRVLSDLFMYPDGFNHMRTVRVTEEERRQGRVAGILLDDEGRVDPDAYATDLSACFCSCPPCSLAVLILAAVTDAHPDATAISFFGRCSVVAKAAVSRDWTNLYLAATV